MIIVNAGHMPGSPTSKACYYLILHFRVVVYAAHLWKFLLFWYHGIIPIYAFGVSLSCMSLVDNYTFPYGRHDPKYPSDWTPFVCENWSTRNFFQQCRCIEDQEGYENKESYQLMYFLKVSWALQINFQFSSQCQSISKFTWNENW